MTRRAKIGEIASKSTTHGAFGLQWTERYSVYTAYLMIVNGKPALTLTVAWEDGTYQGAINGSKVVKARTWREAAEQVVSVLKYGLTRSLKQIDQTSGYRTEVEQTGQGPQIVVIREEDGKTMAFSPSELGAGSLEVKQQYAIEEAKRAPLSNWG